MRSEECHCWFGVYGCRLAFGLAIFLDFAVQDVAAATVLVAAEQVEELLKLGLVYAQAAPTEPSLGSLSLRLVIRS
jgi:hypothetical protein